MPGKTGKVTAAFSSAGRPGGFSKTVTVISNAETPQIILSFKGEVVPKGTPIETPAPAKAPAKKKSTK